MEEYTQDISCPNCNNVLNGESNVCPFCGYDFQVEKEPEQSLDYIETKEEKRTRGLFFLLTFLVVIGFSLAARLDLRVTWVVIGFVLGFISVYKKPPESLGKSVEKNKILRMIVRRHFKASKKLHSIFSDSCKKGGIKGSIKFSFGLIFAALYVFLLYLPLFLILLLLHAAIPAIPPPNYAPALGLYLGAGIAGYVLLFKAIRLRSEHESKSGLLMKGAKAGIRGVGILFKLLFIFVSLPIFWLGFVLFFIFTRM